MKEYHKQIKNIMMLKAPLKFKLGRNYKIKFFQRQKKLQVFLQDPEIFHLQLLKFNQNLI